MSGPNASYSHGYLMMTSITNQADSITSNTPVDPATVTLSGYVLPERYGPESIETTEKDQPEKPSERIGQPGEFPYTRSIQACTGLDCGR